MKKLWAHTKSDEINYELDLTPLLGMMVTLLPLLLLSTAFVRVMVVEAQIPQLVAEAMEQDQKKEDREVTLKVSLKGTKVVEINVIQSGGTSNQIRVEPEKGQFGWDKTHQELTAIKKQFPRVFSLELSPHNEVNYQEIVRFLDEARNARSTDSEFEFTDLTSKAKVQTRLMFPQVTFANVTGQ